MRSAIVRAGTWPVVVFAILLVAGCGGQEPPSQGGKQPSPQGGEGPQELWTFDEDATGGPPQGSEVFGGTWEVRYESDAPTAPNALCQTGEAEFPALVLGDAVYTDVVLSTSFKTISGEEDQAAGLIFRVKDEGNYYIVRANALEDNVAIYKYRDGRRSEIVSESVEVPPGEWQELRVEAVGDRIRGFLGDEQVVETTDDEFPAGGVGLWTKADSVTCFDRVLVEAA